ncbi:hypothetical protein CAPN001_08550 [Capnocytophaga stomatis]|uniref:hypothetical protein n=1 Tax=Capnocytophaga stomatis TaxID=1848904 RepID=UPI0019521ACC|nr:hypothetical protein [Capnocytophaga stomatis]GIJ93006.1 hypothetical protein CAPN002_02240 [Capnocytophaga stomatis]GIJ96286.1 hypothetical protein CAPN001_08550 [Capnocytophaga stomatis]
MKKNKELKKILLLYGLPLLFYSLFCFLKAFKKSEIIYNEDYYKNVVSKVLSEFTYKLENSLGVVGSGEKWISKTKGRRRM